MAGKPSNKDILTRGQKYFEKKKSKDQPKEISFNADDRKEFLTGFHKRKVHRQKVAKEFKEKVAQQEKLEERKKIREDRKQAIQDKLKQIQEGREWGEKLLSGKFDSSDEDDSSADEKEEDKKGSKTKNSKQKKLKNVDEGDEEDEEAEEWYGFDDEPKGILKRKFVFEDENEEDDEETTVTVETLSNNADISSKNGEIDLFKVAKLNCVELDKSEEVLKESVSRAKKYAILAAAPVQRNSRPKQKKKKFRYLSKAERSVNARKERSKRGDRRDRAEKGDRAAK